MTFLPSISTVAAPPQATRVDFRALWPAVFLALIGLMGLVAATLATGSVRGQYLVLSAPWRDREQIMDLVWRADGGVVGFGAAPFLTVAMSNNPNFVALARDQGAWLVLPSPILLGCSGQQKEGRS